MALWIQISPGSKEPIYTQIVQQISRAIALGQVLPGDKLPAVRKLAGELVVNPNTVARAYTLLEQQGLLSTKTGSGTFVMDPALQNTDAAQLNLLGERMDTVITQGLNLGLSQQKLVALFERRTSQFTQGKDRGSSTK